MTHPTPTAPVELADQPAPFGADGCTCSPLARDEDGDTRPLNEDTDRIVGWERSCTCPHHARSVLDPDRLARYTRAVEKVVGIPSESYAEPFMEIADAEQTELREQLQDAEHELGDLRDTAQALYRSLNEHRDILTEAAARGAGVHNALLSLRHRIRHLDRDWAENADDAAIYALLIGWDCEQHHAHTGDCPAAMDGIAEKHRWSPGVVQALRRHRTALAQAGPNGETDAQTARDMADDYPETDR
ncbi:hypothetical protein ACFWV1_25830 [Streptomyces sp. NPDC058700]|uniref:hypothetical protein n=1 Tax=Streptomyces sp. NPDC058700 TaxID=3346607 RepID=UPI00365B97D5